MLAKSTAWDAVMRLLNRPEQIAQEVARQHSQADAHQQTITAGRETLQRALAKSEQADQRWREAYSAGAISLTEFKVYRTDIQQQHSAVKAQMQKLEMKVHALQQQLGQVDALVDHCQCIRDRLQMFSLEEKQLAFDALGLCVTRNSGIPLPIEARIPVVNETNALWIDFHGW